MSGEFRKVGYLTVSGSGNSVKVIVKNKVVGFVGLRDVDRMLKSKSFAATICKPVISRSKKAKTKVVDKSVLAVRIASVSKFKLNLTGEE